MAGIPAIMGGRRRTLCARLVLNGLAQSVAVIITIALVRFAFDHLVKRAPADFNQVLWVGLGLTAAALWISRLRMWALIDAERMGQDYAHEVRVVLFNHLSRVAPRALQGRRQGSMMLRFVGDLTALRRWVSLGVALSTVAGIVLLLGLVALSWLDPVLAASVGALLIVGVAVAIRAVKPMQEAIKESRRRRAYLAANIAEKIASMTVVQVFGQSQRECRRVARQGRRLREAMVAHARLRGRLRAVTEGTAAFAVVAALLAGVAEVASGRATAGTVVAAMTVVRLLRPALRDLARVYQYRQVFLVSLGKIQAFLEAPGIVRDLPGAPDLPGGPGRLEFHRVCLEGVFKDLSVVAEAGARVAIVGPNGAGKSTLLSLAARLIDPDSGSVLVDGGDLAAHSLASVRRAIGMVSADLPLLRGTIEKNLRYRCPEAPEEEVARVLSLCGVDEILARLPRGAQTRLVEGGANLSLGERMRIALARAMLGNPAILLLDEVDAHLDPQAGAVMDRVLSHYRGTVLMVTHREVHLAGADVIWNLTSGRLVEMDPSSRLPHAVDRTITVASSAGAVEQVSI